MIPSLRSGPACDSSKDLHALACVVLMRICVCIHAKDIKMVMAMAMISMSAYTF